MAGAMSNPFEYREVIAAAMKFDTDEDVDTVLARHEQADKARQSARKTPSRAGVSARSAPAPAVVPKSAMAELDKLMEQAAQARSSAATPPAE